MSVRKHNLSPECQQYAKEHIVARAGDNEFTKSDSASLRKFCEQKVLTINSLRSKSLDFLEDWSELRSLKLYGCKIPDCSALTKLRNLRELWYHTNRVKNPDLSFLSRLKKVESLGIGYVTYLTALPDLSGCNHLKSLTIFNCKNLDSVDSVSDIPKLRSFSIVCTPQSPDDLRSIMAMPTLQKMSAAFGSKARDEQFRRMLEDHGLEYG